jgi:hypothetical protein
MQVLHSALLLALAGAAMADSPYFAPAPYAPLPPPPPPPPVHYKADPYHSEHKVPPRPFAYEYGVKDDYSGAFFDKKETQDDNGVVSGEYRVALPDGRTQIVT